MIEPARTAWAAAGVAAPALVVCRQGRGTSLRPLHRMGTRPSEDIDLFSADCGSPGAVADDALDAYRREGLEVTIRLRTADLVQMQVTDARAGSCTADLGVPQAA